MPPLCLQTLTPDLCAAGIFVILDTRIDARPLLPSSCARRFQTRGEGWGVHSRPQLAACRPRPLAPQIFPSALVLGRPVLAALFVWGAEEVAGNVPTPGTAFL